MLLESELTKGKNLNDIQEMNRALVLKIIREKRECSRADIVKITKLQQSTVTNLTADLIACDIVRESKLIKGKRGRRSIGLQLNADKYRIIVLRLTRSSILAMDCNLSGECRHTLKKQISSKDGMEAAVANICELIDQLLAMPGAQVLGIGIGLPGPFSIVKDRIIKIVEFPGWENVSLKERLEPIYGINVYQEFDAYASAMAEWWQGDCVDGAHVLLALSMNGGIGAGIVIDGEIFHGSQGFAGNIGHISIDYNGLPCECGSRGCVRNYCIKESILRNFIIAKDAGETSSVQSANIDDIMDAALAGDALCRRLVTDAARYLGYGLVNIIYAISPEVIVLSREFFRLGNLYLDALCGVLKERLLPAVYDNLRVSFSKLDMDTVLLGTATLVLNRIFQMPSIFFERKDEEQKNP